MAKAEIELSDEQMARLKRVAEDRGMPVIDLVASSIERTLAEAERPPRKRGTGDPSRFIGCIESEETDLARNHDRYLAEAYADEGID